MKTLKSTIEYFRVDRRRISFVKFILEACDGIATLSTLDPAMGIVKITIAPGCEAEFHEVLADLRKDVLFEDRVDPELIQR
ncbi:MAG: DUF4911 domain-containing protein [Proteobacteria bacterium]|nr:DUF4911 domain-containing protein [Desulfobacteraceae bacterium]MBU4002152.1 DUF4911 domain-containing protein [Pseudomonadota bacterium]MBU4054067.1 DUF4911 domain-containing protein [Pseudomonadota bacterium]MBU4318878.1 DUF4911 domain-containing protein [Pseudomonadota bacterium]MBU4469558.1 DUF4911 domain-containing protein [Pseudomonadota bacterium]